MVFPGVLHGCESWIIKKTEHKRIDAFELWCWGRLLDCKDIKPVHPKANLFWIFIGRTDAEVVGPIVWLPEGKNQLIGKDLDAGKDWRQEEKGMAEDEIVGWNHWLDGHKFEQALVVGHGKGRQTCYSLWGPKESDMTEQLNVTENKYIIIFYFFKNHQL